MSNNKEVLKIAYQQLRGVNLNPPPSFKYEIPLGRSIVKIFKTKSIPKMKYIESKKLV